MGPDPNAAGSMGEPYETSEQKERRRRNEIKAQIDAERFCRELEPILAVFLERRDTSASGSSHATATHQEQAEKGGG